MKKISERIIIDNGYKKVFQTFYENDRGKTMDFLTLANSHSTDDNIIALIVTPEGKIVLSREYRYGPEKYVIGVPTGNIDLNESPEDALVREVHEETGYKTSSIIPLGRFIDNPYTRATNYFFIALCDSSESSSPHEFEDITTILVSPEECEEMISDGTIACCFTPAIYFLAKAKTNNFANF